MSHFVSSSRSSSRIAHDSKSKAFSRSNSENNLSKASSSRSKTGRSGGRARTTALIFLIQASGLLPALAQQPPSRGRVARVVVVTTAIILISVKPLE